MRPLVLFLSAVSLALAACGGNDGARSAGPAPSVAVETAPPATSPGGTTDHPLGTADYYAQLVEYVNQGDAICRRATDKLAATLAALPEGTDQPGIGAQDVLFEIAAEALAELRALPAPLGAQLVNPVALCSHRGGSQKSASGPTRAEFIAQAKEICRAAESRAAEYDNGPPARFREAEARSMEEALAQLRALPQPEADRALLEEGFYEVLEQEIYIDREALAAESAGDWARFYLVASERYFLKLQRGAFANPYGLGWCIGAYHD
jgi:hypothetical protein